MAQRRILIQVMIKNNNTNVNNHCHVKEEKKKRKRRGSGGSGKRKGEEKQKEEHENSAKALGQVSRIESRTTREQECFSLHLKILPLLVILHMTTPSSQGGWVAIASTNISFHIILNFAKIFSAFLK